jgi:phosphoribosylanthranilate isomerase
MYRHPVYFTAVTSLTVARYAAAMNIDYIGFCFEPGDPKFMTVAKAKEIMGWLSGVKFLGEFNSKPADEILAIGLELGLDGVVLKGDYSMIDLDSIPFLKITMDKFGDLQMENGKIFDKSGNIFATCIETGTEDDTGIVDFTPITEVLEKLEI